MTKIVYLCLIWGVFAFTGCVEQAAEQTPEPAAADVIELSEEELDVLEATNVDTNQVDLGEISADNYEEVLDKLEQALDSEE